jgi:hypothetical protein
LKDFKLFLVIYFDNHKLIDIDYILGDVSWLSIVDLSKTLLETSISFSTPHLQQNHVNPNVGSVHRLAPDSQRAINQQCDGEVSSPEHAPIGRPSHGS